MRFVLSYVVEEMTKTCNNFHYFNPFTRDDSFAMRISKFFLLKSKRRVNASFPLHIQTLMNILSVCILSIDTIITFNSDRMKIYGHYVFLLLAHTHKYYRLNSFSATFFIPYHNNRMYMPRRRERERERKEKVVIMELLNI